MTVAIITGSSGLIGSEAAQLFHEKGLDIVGIDNNSRRHFFGDGASIEENTVYLQRHLKRYTHFDSDIRDQEGMGRIFSKWGRNISVVVHAAGQPSHDWASCDPMMDFHINASGTLVLLEAARRFSRDATFIFTSTNKVYGDTPNSLPLVEKETRWELVQTHPYFSHGIDEKMSIDQSKHSLFGASKVAADIMVQEYGRYFGMNTGIFRGGCLTGPRHAGAELHGFLAYLVKCAIAGKPYTILGYKGKQVRDNVHSSDTVTAFWNFFQHPRPGEVYNFGGSRHSNCSVLEAMHMIEELSNRKVEYILGDQPRAGDHVWWVSDVRKFRKHYPEWSYQHDLRSILHEMIEAAQKQARLRSV